MLKKTSELLFKCFARNTTKNVAYFFVITFNYAKGKLNFLQAPPFLLYPPELNCESFLERRQSNRIAICLLFLDGFAFECCRVVAPVGRSCTQHTEGWVLGIGYNTIRTCYSIAKKSVVLLKYCAYEMICARGNSILKIIPTTITHQSGRGGG